MEKSARSYSLSTRSLLMAMVVMTVLMMSRSASDIATTTPTVSLVSHSETVRWDSRLVDTVRSKESSVRPKLPVVGRKLPLPEDQRPIVDFMHIPKTAGTSFYTEFKDVVRFTDISPGKNERCYSWKPEKDKIVVFFRNPLAHVYSQYVMCKSSTWGHKMTRTTSFPRDSKIKEDFSAGFVPLFERWLDHFLDGAKDCYRCYHPYNMQARFLQCPPPPRQMRRRDEAKFTGHQWMDNIQWDLDEMKEKLKEFGTVGLTEYYHESTCLFLFANNIRLPESCNCNMRKSRSSQSHNNESHNVPKHPVYALPEKILSKMRNLTRVDHDLYDLAKEEFIERIRLAEEKLGYNILCPHDF